MKYLSSEMFGQEVYEHPRTVISKEYFKEWDYGIEPYYPVNDVKNSNWQIWNQMSYLVVDWRSINIMTWRQL